jgi:large subunit ribosomal protein L25
MLTLDIEKRPKAKNLNAMRKQGKMPAVYYGRKEKACSVYVTQKDFIKVWKQAGENTVISLKEGVNEIEALIKDVDNDPVTGAFRHADFYVIEKGRKLQIDIPLNFVGIAPAVKELGGILVKVLHRLKIQALPKDFPAHIDVDIFPLATFENQVLAKDLKLPAGVELIEKPDEVVASVTKPVEEKEEVAVAPDLSAIEVEKKGKKEEEGAPAEGVGAATAPAKEDAKTAGKGGKEAKK